MATAIGKSDHQAGSGKRLRDEVSLLSALARTAF
jgi:hypothetical protein